MILTVAEYIFFLSVHRTFSRLDQVFYHKKSFNKFKKIEMIPSNISGHNRIKIESNSRRKTGKFKIKQHILINQRVKEVSN